MPTPEDKARETIDHLLTEAGWAVQDKKAVNLTASRGVAVRELTFKTGEPDYTLFVDSKAIGTIEAKPAGYSLTGVEEQSEKYVKGVPFGIPAWRSPLPFSCESTGTETRFTNQLDPVPRSRSVFAFHRPEMLLGWLENDAPARPVESIADYANRKGNFLRRIQHMPPLIDDIWPPKSQAIMNLELSDAGEAPEMVRVPAGSFWMGDDNGPADEKSRHQVQVAEFFIDRTKVTNVQFARFMNARGTQAAGGQRWYDTDDNDARIHRRSNQWMADPGHENDPVVEASWYGALAYCQWLGKRLPTEAEWEKAARGTDGRKYPWGNEPPDKTRAHFSGGWNELKPVGSFPKGASPYGVLDMAGNGWEWVSSAYVAYPDDAKDGREDLSRDAVRGTRGGGHNSRPGELTTTQRGRHVARNPRGGHHNIAFRCAR